MIDVKGLTRRCMVFTTLTLTLSCVAQDSKKTQEPDNNSPLMLAGDWVPDDPRQIDFDKLPRLAKSDHAIVHDVRPLDGHRVNQHNYMIFHDGLYWMMWSDGPGVVRAKPGEHRDKVPGHDQPTQKVSFSTSKDGLKWSEAKDITDSPTGGYGWIARGFWLYNGKLLALITRFKGPGYAGYGLALHAFELEPSQKWKHLGIAYDNAMNNFPPKQLPSGEWMMSRRDSSKNVHLLYGATTAYNEWKSVPAVEYEGTNFKAEEPCWWVLPDNNNLLSLYRDNGKSGFLYRSFSNDNGRTWSRPVKTNFPDATSKFSDTRLKDGRYILVSNPNPKKRDPMTIAVSDDGVVFNKMIYLVGGRHIDYPHVMEHDGYLFVAFASAKQSVEVIRVSIKELDKVKMPSTPLVIK
jgi:BNR repeat-like domain